MQVEIKDMKVNAFVKGLELDCYGWDHEDRLTIVSKITDLDAEHGIYLFQAYNHDKHSWGGVTTTQVIWLDKSLLESPALMGDCDIVSGMGSMVVGIKKVGDGSC